MEKSNYQLDSQKQQKTKQLKLQKERGNLFPKNFTSRKENIQAKHTQTVSSTRKNFKCKSRRAKFPVHSPKKPSFRPILNFNPQSYFQKKLPLFQKRKPQIKTSQLQELEINNYPLIQMNHIDSALNFQLPFSNTSNAFEQFDFSLKKTDSCDFLNFGNGLNPLATLTNNKSIVINNNSNNANFNNSKAQNTHNELAQFPWLNQHEQENNNFGNHFQEANNFSLNYVSSFPAVCENRKNYNHNDEYDFMNLNSDDNENHFDNISNFHNSEMDFFQRNHFENEIEQVKTNQSFFNQVLTEQKNQQMNFFDQQLQSQKNQIHNNYTAETQNSFCEANLLKIDDFKEMPPEMIIEPYSEEEQRQIREENERREKDGQPKICERDLHGRRYEKIIQKRRDYDKNICRYIARQMMRCFISEEYKEIILKRFCYESEETYEKIVPFIRSSIPKISGHRAFKDLLAILKEEEEDVKQQKVIFRKFAKWFLRERSLRYIMLGNSEDKTQYIRFKNQVMLHFINKPEQWNANLKINPKPFKVRNMSFNQYSNPVYQDATTSSQDQL
ncbi:hypothetical protein ABPG72_005310 [Tetrahymena utriculariae]